MTSGKVFKLFTICLLLAWVVTGAAITRTEKFSRDIDKVIQLNGQHRQSGPARDADDLLTYRFMFSADGAENWSDPMGLGDHGMYEIKGEGAEVETVGAWGAASYDMGAVIDNDNYIHFIAVLNSFSEDYNPFGRVNGLYDVSADCMGENVEYTLIAEQGDGEFFWSDGGRDMDGNLYAIWVNVVTPEEGDAYGQIWAAKKTGAAWGNAVLIVDMIDAANNFPHMTYMVGDYFWVIYEMPNVESGRFDHYTVKVSSDLATIDDPISTGASSSHYFSYYVGANDPIAQDYADEAYPCVYFTTLNDYNVNTWVGHMGIDEEAWSLENLTGPSRYPSMMMQPDEEIGGTPWVFSNVGPPAGGSYHHDWYTNDANGYNGGDWLPQTPVDSAMYEGGRFILYCHQGVLTTDGRLVSGVNAWGQFTPEAFRVKYSDDMGENWSDANELWSIFDEGETFVGGYIAQNCLLAGQENSVWVAFCGQYGETDFTPPKIEVTGLSSFMLGESWVVSAEITDAASMVTYADINWTLGNPEDPEAEWDYLENDSAQVDDAGYGAYFFTLPSDTMLGQALTAGQEIWFYVYAEDESGNAGGSYEAKITVNEGWLETPKPSAIPVTVELGQNYPNPFNSSTSIPFTLDRTANVRLSIYDVTGREVTTLKNGWLPEGRHTYSWNGDGVSTGVYFAVLETGDQRYMSKITLLR